MIRKIMLTTTLFGIGYVVGKGVAEQNLFGYVLVIQKRRSNHDRHNH